MTAQQWEATAAVLSSDPWLRPPSAADRVLVEQLGYVVDETAAGAA